MDQLTDLETAQADPAPAPQPVAPLAAVPAPQPVAPLAPKSRGKYRRRRNPARRVERPVITPRVGFFTKDDGSIDFDRTSDETIQKIAAAVKRPEAMQRLGLVDQAGEPVAPRTWGSTSTMLVDALNGLLVQGAANVWKLTDDQAKLLILRRDPATHAGVTQLTGELLDKYFPGGFGAYDKEITLAVLLGGFALNAVQEIQKMRLADQAAAPLAAAA
jgi:hypothetical protein